MTKPQLPRDLRELPPPPPDDNSSALPQVLTQTLAEWPVVSFHREPDGSPKTYPRSNGFVTVVEWPLCPGSTRIEAYFIGTDQHRKNWFLWQFTMNDLVPRIPKYIEKKPIAKVARQKLSKSDAAALLLKAVWEHEKYAFMTDRFMMVSDSGCLSRNTTNAIADLVWDDEDDDQ